MSRIIFCGIINGVRRRREGTEGGGGTVARSSGGGGGGGGVWALPQEILENEVL